MPVAQKEDPVRYCATCNAPLERKRFNGRLEDRTRFLSRVTCGQSCGNTRSNAGKSAMHRRAVKFRGERCEECGTTDGLHAHHIDGDVTNNAAENIATLCGSCHLLLHWRTSRRRG